MRTEDGAGGQESDGLAIERIGQALHDLCQPLTTLQCRLEMAELVGTAEAYREAVSLALVECGRLVEGVHSMREILHAKEHCGYETLRSPCLLDRPTSELPTSGSCPLK